MKTQTRHREALLAMLLAVAALFLSCGGGAKPVSEPPETAGPAEPKNPLALRARKTGQELKPPIVEANGSQGGCFTSSPADLLFFLKEGVGLPNKGPC